MRNMVTEGCFPIKVLKVFIKPFEGPQRGLVKLIFSLHPGSGEEGLRVFSLLILKRYNFVVAVSPLIIGNNRILKLFTTITRSRFSRSNITFDCWVNLCISLLHKRSSISNLRVRIGG